MNQTSETDPHWSRSWRPVFVAAVVMLATLPGRTQGLGLFTEPILKTSPLDRETYGLLNLMATLLGALFCVPVGWLMDRWGERAVLLIFCTLLAGTVVLMSQWGVLTLWPLSLFLLFTRGFGQSALSVVSLGIIGRAANTQTGLKMGIYSCLISVFFVAVFGVLQSVIRATPDDWQTPWAGIGGMVLCCGFLGVLLLPRVSHGIPIERQHPISGRTLFQALRTTAFWTFALGTSFYGMVAAGTSLFNESILGERGFDKGIFLNATIIGIPIGLVANLLGGWWAMRASLPNMFAVAQLFFALTLLSFPHITQAWQVYVYAMSLAACGGVITVCFFTVWRKYYGPTHLGKIQGAAQFLTVLCSGFGQWLFPAIQKYFQEYAPLFPVLAGVAFLLALLSWWTPKTLGSEGHS